MGPKKIINLILGALEGLVVAKTAIGTPRRERGRGGVSCKRGEMVCESFFFGAKLNSRQRSLPCRGDFGAAGCFAKIFCFLDSQDMDLVPIVIVYFRKTKRPKSTTLAPKRRDLGSGEPGGLNVAFDMFSFRCARSVISEGKKRTIGS